MEGVKYDAGKPRCGLLPPHAMLAVGRVLGYGAAKYEDHNYRKGLKHSRLSDAALRHLFAYLGGENTDRETDESHVTHAAACLLMLVQLMHDHPELDDRFRQPKVEDSNAKVLDHGGASRSVCSGVCGNAVDGDDEGQWDFHPVYGC